MLFVEPNAASRSVEGILDLVERRDQPMRIVTGQKDPAIVLLRELLTEDGRRRRGRHFIEGAELVLRAFNFGTRVEIIIRTDRFARTDEAAQLARIAEAAGVEVCEATEGLLAKVLESKPIPGCLAVLERRTVPLSEVFAEGHSLVQMVESGENADNLGMLLRSTDAAGADAVVLSGETVDPFSRKVVRGSRGAVFTVPICIAPDSAAVIAAARSHGFQVIAASASAETPHVSVDFTRPTVIAVGNEHVGLSETVREMADSVVRIPMRGRINSLNIAVAASIMLYEALRQRG